MILGSQGLQDIFEKIVDPLPAWVKKMQDKDPSWQQQSQTWLKSKQAKKLLGRTGRKLRWINLQENNKPWQEDFVKDQEKKRANLSVPKLIRKLQSELGLLPLFRPPIASQIACRDGLTKWDYLVLRLAVGHLLSWESWNHRTANPDPRYGDERAIAACG